MSFESALSGLKGASAQLDVVGNNIANSSTTGFKESRAEFAEFADSGGSGGQNAVGAGVYLSGVVQEFSQGNINFTEKNLDMAVNGEGFFRLSNNGVAQYTRAGSFHLDKTGNIVSNSGYTLMGYGANTSGEINGILQDLVISDTELAPKATTTTTTNLNLDASASLPAVDWVGTSTFGGTVPATNTYNFTNVATIYDSLGNSHTLNLFYSKSGIPSTWHARVQIDGVDISSTAKSVESSAGSMLDAGGLTAMSSGDLTIGGTTVGAGASDGKSTSDADASAIAIATAINAVSGTTNVTATVHPTYLNLGAYTAGALGASEFQINGTDIIVNSATKGALLNAINAVSATTGVGATENASSQIVLTAADARNIQITSDGSATLATFSNFSTAGGSALDKVQRGSVILKGANNIVLAGTTPANAGLTAGTYITQIAEPYKMVFDNSGKFDISASDTLSLNWTPLDSVGNATGSVQTLSVSFPEVTQYGTSFNVQSIDPDGYSSGRLNNIDISDDGTILGRYSNGQSNALGQLVLFKFTNLQGLTPLSDTTWGESFSSGSAVVGEPGTGSLGTILAGALEESNVGLTDELVNLIVAQRNFQANAQTIRTEDTVTQSIINLR